MFTDAEKAEAEALLGEAFATYKETVIIYKTPTETIIESSDYIFGFQDQPALTKTYVSQSGQFYATIEYIDQTDNQQLANIPFNSPVSKNLGFVRMSVSGSAARAYLEDVKKIVFDGKDFLRVSDIMPRGLFSRQGFDCWLQKIDNG